MFFNVFLVLLADYVLRYMVIKHSSNLDYLSSDVSYAVVEEVFKS